MNKQMQSMLLTLAMPIIKDVVRSMATTDMVLSAREKVIAFGRELTGRTATKIDDALWQSLEETAFNLEYADKWAGLIGALLQYASHPKTPIELTAVEFLSALQDTFEMVDVDPAMMMPDPTGANA